MFFTCLGAQALKLPPPYTSQVDCVFPHSDNTFNGQDACEHTFERLGAQTLLNTVPERHLQIVVSATAPKSDVRFRGAGSLGLCMEYSTGYFIQC